MTELHNMLLTAVPKFPRGVRLKHDEARQEWVLLAPERLSNVIQLLPPFYNYVMVSEAYQKL
jgi:hypothetical protein